MNITDPHLTESQHHLREENHGPSACSQAHSDKPASRAQVDVGDLIYLKGDGDKHTARDKYIVTSTEDTCLFAKIVSGLSVLCKVLQA